MSIVRSCLRCYPSHLWQYINIEATKIGERTFMIAQRSDLCIKKHNLTKLPGLRRSSFEDLKYELWNIWTFLPCVVCALWIRGWALIASLIKVFLLCLKQKGKKRFLFALGVLTSSCMPSDEWFTSFSALRCHQIWLLLSFADQSSALIPLTGPSDSCVCLACLSMIELWMFALFSCHNECMHAWGWSLEWTLKWWLGGLRSSIG